QVTEVEGDILEECFRPASPLLWQATPERYEPASAVSFIWILNLSSVILSLSRYQRVASTSVLCGGASFHPRSSRLEGTSTLSENLCSSSDESFPGQAPWSPIVNTSYGSILCS